MDDITFSCQAFLELIDVTGEVMTRGKTEVRFVDFVESSKLAFPKASIYLIKFLMAPLDH